jgi:hypothetical protein
MAVSETRMSVIDGAYLATEARLPNSRVSHDHDLDSAHE